MKWCSHKRPVNKGEGQAMDSGLISFKDFPGKSLFIRNMAPHCWHADSHRQASISLSLKLKSLANHTFTYITPFLMVGFGFTCCINLTKSEHNALRPDSSNNLSSVMSWRATRVVSSMSSPAWFANMKTGCDCKIKTKALLDSNNYEDCTWRTWYTRSNDKHLAF